MKVDREVVVIIMITEIREGKINVVHQVGYNLVISRVVIEIKVQLDATIVDVQDMNTASAGKNTLNNILGTVITDRRTTRGPLQQIPCLIIHLRKTRRGVS